MEIKGYISLPFENPLFYRQEIEGIGVSEAKAKGDFLQNSKDSLFEFLQKYFFTANFSLLYNKYSLIQHIPGWLRLNEKGIGDEMKKVFLEVLRKHLNKVLRENKKVFLSYVSQKKLAVSGYKLFLNKPFRTSSRLIIGLGGTSPLETSITLHHTFGIPYIPGTALKGVCRMVAFWKIFEFIKEEIKEEKGTEKYVKSLQNKFYGSLQKEKIEVSHEDDKEKKVILGEKAKNEFLKYQFLFGAQDFKGLFLFLDSYPDFENIKDNNIFDLDITNVHYPEYYGGGNVAGDWENPRPIFFLTVSPGVPFSITVLFDQYRFEKLKGNEEFGKIISSIDFSPERLKVEEIIKEALEEFGVGAKTRLGYGLFKE